MMTPTCIYVDGDGVICDQPRYMPSPVCEQHRDEYFAYMDFCEQAKQVALNVWDWADIKAAIRRGVRR